MLAPEALLQNCYLIPRPIGKGGMGTVYLAKDERLGNTIAFKETFFEDELLRKAFERQSLCGSASMLGAEPATHRAGTSQATLRRLLP